MAFRAVSKPFLMASTKKRPPKRMELHAKARTWAVDGESEALRVIVPFIGMLFVIHLAKPWA